MSDPVQSGGTAPTQSAPALDLSGIGSFIDEMSGGGDPAPTEAAPEAAPESTKEKDESLGDMFDKFEQENKEKKNEAEAPEEVDQGPIDLGKLEKFTYEGKEYTPKEFKDGFLRQDDYTKKTMAIADERKSYAQKVSALEAKEKSFSETMTKSKERLEQLEELDYFIDHIATANPELLDTIKSELGGFRTHYANPIVKNLQKKLEAIESTFSKHDTDREVMKVKSQYDNEVSTLQKDLIPEIESLGLKIDMDKVNKIWEAGEDAGITVKQALNALYGDEIRNLYKSKIKVSQVEKETKVAPKVVSSSSTRSLPVKQKVDTKKMSWNEMASYLGGIDLAS